MPYEFAPGDRVLVATFGLQRQTGTLRRKTRLPWNLREGWVVELDTPPLFGRRTQRIGQQRSSRSSPCASRRTRCSGAMSSRPGTGSSSPAWRCGGTRALSYAEPGCLGTSKKPGSSTSTPPNRLAGRDNRSVRASWSHLRSRLKGHVERDCVMSRTSHSAVSSMHSESSNTPPLPVISGEELRGLVRHVATGTESLFLADEEILDVLHQASGPRTAIDG